MRRIGRRGREPIDPGNVRQMVPMILEHIGDRARDLRGRGEWPREVMVGKDAAAAAHQAIECPRHADGQPLHAAGERYLCVRLDDEMHVIALQREVHQAKALAYAPLTEGFSERRPGSAAAQAADMRQDPQNHMRGVAAVKLRPRAMRDQRLLSARLPPRALPHASPGLELQWKLLCSHLE